MYTDEQQYPEVSRSIQRDIFLGFFPHASAVRIRLRSGRADQLISSEKSTTELDKGRDCFFPPWSAGKAASKGQ